MRPRLGVWLDFPYPKRKQTPEHRPSLPGGDQGPAVGDKVLGSTSLGKKSPDGHYPGHDAARGRAHMEGPKGDRG